MSTDLSKRNDWRFAGAVVMEWACIAATLIVASRAHHVGLWLVAIFILGTRQQAIGILGHECVHRSACASPRLNDIVGQVCCFWPVWSDLYAYRTFHFAHHRFLNTPQDPELEYRQMGAPDWDVPAPPNRIVIRFLFDLIGLGFMEAGRMFWIAKPRTMPARSSIALAWLTAAAVLWAAGALWVLVPWVVALFTSLVAVFRLRCWIEHLGSDGTHRVHLPPWLRWLVAPHGTWMHWEHHKMPGVPY
jgi:fatty acid desaturase